MLSWKDFLLIFGVGGVIGAICDGFHSHTNILYYPNEWFLKAAWWVPLLFGVASLAVAYGHLFYDRLVHRPRITLSWANVIAGLIGFVAIYAGSAFLPLSESTKTIVLSIGVILMIRQLNPTWYALPPLLITALIGCTVESILSHWGYFHYTHPDILDIPMWLPLLYAAASIGIGNWARKLSK